MRIVFADEALRAVETIDTWWREHRTKAPDLFARELALALEQIDAAPQAQAIYAATRHGLVRRILLPKTRHHLYYLHVPEAGLLRVITIWGAVKGAGPPLE